jgi:hypothetical protein
MEVSYMIKGVNKLIVDVANPNSEFFERAIFFVKPQMKDTSPTELNKSANALITEQVSNKATKHGKVFPVLICVSAAGLGAAITALIVTLL